MQHTKLKPVKQDDEIHKIFFNTVYSPVMLDDFSRIRAALNPKVITRNLKKLEFELQKILDKKGMLTKNNNGEVIIIKKTPDKKYTSQYHALTEFMTKWGKDNGLILPTEVSCIEKDQFGQEKRVTIKLPEKPPVVVGGILDTSTFVDVLLVNGNISKDISAGVSHGEFTHFLQIYSIVQENKDNPFLQHNPVELIKMSGDAIVSDITLWGIIFDQGPKAGTFSDPDYLNAELVKPKLGSGFLRNTQHLNTHEFPILASILKGRADKREPNYQKGASMFFLPYTSKVVQNKYLLKKNGLVINDAIYYETNDAYSRDVLFDDIKHMLKVHKEFFNTIEVELPISEELDPIDQLIQLFSMDNYDDFKDSDTENLLTPIFTLMENGLKEFKEKSSRPGAILHYREVMIFLQLSLDAANELQHTEAEKYFNSAFTCALNLLEKFSNEPDIENRLTERARVVK